VNGSGAFSISILKPKETHVGKFILAFVLCLAVSGCATHAMTSGQIVLKDDSSTVDVRIGDRDRGLIESYYKPGKKKRKGSPPGLARRDRLPPGLRGDFLPSDLEAKLSPLPSGYIRVRVGQDIVLMDGRTRVVFDILHDVAF